MMEVAVNGKIIAEREIARETQYHPAADVEDARRKAAEALVVRELLLQQASRLSIEADDGTDEARISALIEREVKTPRADEENCRRYYQGHLARFCSPDLVEARHILFVADPDDAEALSSARAKAESAIEVLKKRPDCFAELARELSACPSAKQGGSLGQVTRGSTVPEIETFLFELEPGQLCPVPIRSRYGFHVLEVQQRVNGRTLPFVAVHKKIADYLEERVWRQAVQQYIGRLVGAAEISGIEIKGYSSPLVQ
jgi:peptidyl-prolyl cis-trans isomerase C